MIEDFPSRRRFIQLMGGGLMGTITGCAASMSNAAVGESSKEQVTELTAGDADPGDQFGRSVAVGEATAFVGAPMDEASNGGGTGSTYVFARSNGTWSQQAKLAVPDGETADRFGRAVAVSRGGETALVGAPGLREGTEPGSVYAFERSGGKWSHQTTLTAPDGDAKDFFGFAIALARSGTTAVIGAPGSDAPNEQSGAVYTFERSGGAWRQQSKLTPEDGDANDQFGNAVAIADDSRTVLVGARNDEHPHGATQNPVRGGGSAYVFERLEGGWRQQTKLLASDGDAGDFFGNAVALTGEGRTAVIGARLDEDPNGPGSGSAYIFGQNANGGWTQKSKLTADDGDQGDDFGRGVAITATNALVGARNDENQNGDRSGSAYVFGESGGEWSQRVKLAAPDGESNDRFGIVVAMNRSGKLGLVGAPGPRDGTKTGSAYLFSL